MQAATSMNIDQCSANREQNVTAQGWWVVLTAALFFFYEFIQLNVLNAINLPIMQEFHLNAPQLGQLASMYFYANAIFLFPAGLLLDRYSTKRILSVAVVVSTFGTLLFAIAQSYAVAALGRFLVGTGSAFCFLGCIRLASRWFPPRKMASVTGVVVTMAMIGGLVAQTPMALLTQYLGSWRHAMMTNVGLGVFIGLAIMLFVRDNPPVSYRDSVAAHPHTVSPFSFWQSIKLAVLNPLNWYNGLYTSLLNLPVFLLGALWGINYLVSVHHITDVQASYATTLFFVGVVFGAPAFGWFSDYIERRILPMIIGAILSLATIAVLMWAPNLSLAQLMLLFFLIGFVTSSQVLSYPTIAELNPASITSTAVSIASVTIMSSGAIFQPFFGWMMELKWDHQVVNNIPIYAPSDFMHAMLILPVAFIIGLLLTALIKETYCRAQV